MAYNLKRAEQKPEYISTSLTSNVLSSLKNVVTSGTKGFKGGKSLAVCSLRVATCGTADEAV